MNRSIALTSALTATALTSVGCDFYFKPPLGAEPIVDTGEDDAPDVGEPDHPDEPGSDEPSVDLPVAIDSTGWGCDEDAFWFEVYTTGWATGGWLYMYQTGSSTPWNEDHPVDAYETDTEGYWTHLYLALDSVYPDASAMVSGSTTLYLCDDYGMQDTLTYIIEVDDSEGHIGVDCVVWGDNPDAAPASDCARITPDSVSRLR